MIDLDQEDESGATTFDKRFQQFIGLFLKRFHHSRRNFKGLVSQIFLPAIFVCIAMTVAMSRPGYEKQPQLILSPSMIRPLPNFIPFNNEGESQISKRMENSLRLPSGVGADCVLKHVNSSMKVVRPRPNSAAVYDGLCEKQAGELDAEDASQSDADDASGKQRRFVDLRGKKCRCSDDKRSYICDEGVEGNPEETATITGDRILNVTGRRMEEYLLYTTQHFRRHR